MDGNGKDECGWVKLWVSAGVQVTLPVTAKPLDYAAMLASVNAMLAAGFLPAQPGVEPGEHRDDVGYVVRRAKDNEDGSQTPLIDLYPADDGMKFALLSVYLNRPDDLAAFEHAGGVRVENLPVYIGANKIERGKSRQTDQLVVKCPRPFGVVWKDNPKYDPNEQDTAKKKPKRLFVRWADQRPATQAAASPPAETPYQGALGDIAAAGDLPTLVYVWDEVTAAWDRFTPAERVELTARKDKRKRELTPAPNPGQVARPPGKLFAAGEKPTDPTATVRH